MLLKVSSTAQLQFPVWQFKCGTAQAWLCWAKFTIHFQHSCLVQQTGLSAKVNHHGRGNLEWCVEQRTSNTCATIHCEPWVALLACHHNRCRLQAHNDTRNEHDMRKHPFCAPRHITWQTQTYLLEIIVQRWTRVEFGVYGTRTSRC